MTAVVQLFQPRHSDTIVSHIQNLVRQGVLKAGDRLPPERQLARQLNLGRGTVREALQQLEALGVIRRSSRTRIVGGTDAKLQKPSNRTIEEERQFLLQVIEVRIGLEGWVAAEAARKADRTDLARLGRVMRKLESAVSDQSKLAAADLEFHQTLVKATHNAVVAQVLDSLSTMIESIAAFKRLTLDPMRKVDTTLHRQIVDAIERKDARAAQEAMVAHLTKVRSAIQAE